MSNSITNGVDHIAGNVSSGKLPGGTASTFMNHVNDTTNPLSVEAGKEQKDRALDIKNFTDQMITAKNRKTDETSHVDLGCKDNRPSDLDAQFDPKMDQQKKLHTGRGDDTVIIV